MKMMKYLIFICFFLGTNDIVLCQESIDSLEIVNLKDTNDNIQNSKFISSSELDSCMNLLKLAINDYNISKQSKRLWDIRIANYRYQLLNISNLGGDKLIYLNGICIDDPIDILQFKNELIVNHDGGKCYFNVIINLSTLSWTEFYVNGN